MKMALLNEVQRRDWLRLAHSENVGPVTFRQLIGRYGSASAALENLAELSRRGGLKRPLKLFPLDKTEAAFERAEKMGAHFVVAGEAGYPPLLYHTRGAPPMLCVKGALALTELDAVAIVGARNASAAGLRLARQISAELSEEGYLVVSGLARGIDTAAHEAAPYGRTAAVIAGGIDNIYPPENADLQQLIATHGLLLTEMLPGGAPRAEHFPRRNRIISGMAKAVIVVEAALKSGSLITARLAAEQDRDVFAVPGSPLDPRAAGTNRLIKNGAMLLTCTQDVLDVLRQNTIQPDIGLFAEADHMREEYEPNSDDRARVLSYLSYSPIDIDDLIRESGLSAGIITGIVLEYELAGKVTRLPNQKISLL